MRAPLAALMTVLALGVVMLACGSDDDGDDATTTTSSTPVWSGDVETIISDSCGTSSCHGPGAQNTVFVGSEATVTASASSILTRIQLDPGDALYMPSAARASWTEANKQRVIDYLNAL